LNLFIPLREFEVNAQISFREIIASTNPKIFEFKNGHLRKYLVHLAYLVLGCRVMMQIPLQKKGNTLKFKQWKPAQKL
jgi:hypothetical protein